MYTMNNEIRDFVSHLAIDSVDVIEIGGTEVTGTIVETINDEGDTEGYEYQFTADGETFDCMESVLDYINYKN